MNKMIDKFAIKKRTYLGCLVDGKGHDVVLGVIDEIGGGVVGGIGEVGGVGVMCKIRICGLKCKRKQIN